MLRVHTSLLHRGNQQDPRIAVAVLLDGQVLPHEGVLPLLDRLHVELVQAQPPVVRGDALVDTGAVPVAS